MDFDALKMVVLEKRAKEKDRKWFEADPAKIYPATVKRIKQVIKGGILPEELLDYSPDRDPMVSPGAGAMMYVRDAKQINANAWIWALKPRSGFTKAEQIGARALALEIARRWFTRALHMQLKGEPLGLHITKNEDYRL